MKHALFVLFFLAGCGPSPGYYDVEEPDEQAQPRGTPTVQVGPCAGTTAAVRSQARWGRYVGVDGFSSRNCNSVNADRVHD